MATARNTTHGHASHDNRAAEYRVWTGAKSRCSNTSQDIYRHYGGRGIVMCDAWKDSFAQFLADMGPRPTAKHSLDRIDNNGPYSKDNCRWTTTKVQQNNRRNNRIVEINGRAMTLTQACELFGPALSVVHARLSTGWRLSAALILPVEVHRRHR